MIKSSIKILLIIFFLQNSLFAKSEYLQEGIILFNKNKLEDAKFKFEKDLVFNPKSESSYLYLSKIFNKQDKKELEEQNLNAVILLNPKNEEAIYNLAKLKLFSSDFQKSRELNKRLKLICRSFCLQSDKLKFEIENLSKK
jgi:tetratricopeptide (TPR) repeat protein